MLMYLRCKDYQNAVIFYNVVLWLEGRLLTLI